jgi:hypothetical protein
MLPPWQMEKYFLVKEPLKGSGLNHRTASLNAAFLVHAMPTA